MTATNAPGCLKYVVKHKDMQQRINFLSNRGLHFINIVAVLYHIIGDLPS